MLKKTCEDVTKQCIIKAGISKKEDALNETDTQVTGNFSDDEYSLEDLEINLNQHWELGLYIGPHKVITAMLIDVDTNNSTDASELFIVEEIIVEISGEVQQIIDDKCEKIKQTNSAPVLQNKKSSRTKEITYACPR